MTDPNSWPTGADVAAWRVGSDATAALVAQGAIQDYCRWHIAPVLEDDIVTVNGSGTIAQFLPTLMLLGVSALTELRPGGPYPSTPVDLEPDVDFEWAENGTLTKLPGTATWAASGYCWTPRLRGVVATITHGYESLPAAVLGVALSVAARAADSANGLTRVQRGPFAESKATGPDGAAIGSGLTSLEEKALSRYRIPL